MAFYDSYFSVEGKLTKNIQIKNLSNNPNENKKMLMFSLQLSKKNKDNSYTNSYINLTCFNDTYGYLENVLNQKLNDENAVIKLFVSGYIDPYEIEKDNKKIYSLNYIVSSWHKIDDSHTQSKQTQNNNNYGGYQNTNYNPQQRPNQGFYSEESDSLWNS